MSKKRKQQKQPPRPPVGVPDIVLSLIPALFLAGLRTIAGPCVHEDGTAAACTSTGTVLTALAVGSLVLVLMRLLAADLRTKRSFDLLLTIAGVAIAVLPGTVLTLCMMATMRCHTIMLPFARVVGVALVLCALACEFTVDHEVPTGRKRRR